MSEQKNKRSVFSIRMFRDINLCRDFPLFVSLCAVSGGIIAWSVHVHPVHGVALGVLIGFSPLALLGLLVGLMQLWRPDYPRCLCGARNYDFITTIKPETDDSSTWQYRSSCLACGKHYIASGSTFQMITDNCTLQPYMIHSEFGRWRRDEASFLIEHNRF